MFDCFIHLLQVESYRICLSVVRSLSHVQHFATPWTASHQASPSFAISQSLSFCVWFISHTIKLSRFIPIIIYDRVPFSFRAESYSIVASWWLSRKESAFSVGDTGLISGSGRCPRGVHGNPLQYSCLENPMDGGV